jgi:toxin YoeB
MKINFSKSAYKDLLYWQRKDAKKYLKIKELITNILNNPYHGIGKPEPLKFELSGFWSRRIDKQNRLVYRISNDDLEIVSCRYHY